MMLGEEGCLSNAEGAARRGEDSYQTEVALTIFGGVADYTEQKREDDESKDEVRL